jgi:hypothetical protein
MTSWDPKDLKIQTETSEAHLESPRKWERHDEEHEKCHFSHQEEKDKTVVERHDGG